MKKVVIKQFDFAELDAPKETFGFVKVPEGHKWIRAEGENLEISDGYHTMDELYEHRVALYIQLASAIEIMNKISRDKGWSTNAPVWRSKVHSDGSRYEGWFILGIEKEAGKQITYHIPEKYWDSTEFAETLIKAPEWDKHTSADVLERIKNF